MATNISTDDASSIHPTLLPRRYLHTLLLALLILALVACLSQLPVLTGVRQIPFTLIPNPHPVSHPSTITATSTPFDLPRHLDLSDKHPCHFWSPRNLLLPSKRTRVSHSRPLGLSVPLVRSLWQHDRSDAPAATGVIQSVVHHCLPSSSSSLPIPDLSHQISPTSALCVSLRPAPTVSQHQDAPASVRVIELPDRTWNDLIPVAPQGANLWHFHASNFRVWLSLPIFHALRHHHRQTLSTNSSSSNTILPIPSSPILLVLPHAAWTAASFPSSARPFLASPQSLVDLRNAGVPDSPLEGLQGLADALGVPLLVVRASTSLSVVADALVSNNLPTRLSAWIVPPADGLFWDIAHDPLLAKSLSKCSNSLIQIYANHLLFPSNPLSPTLPPTSFPTTRPTHVCIMSRQSRERVGAMSRGKLRNFEQATFISLLQRLGSPIVLSPSLALRPVQQSSLVPVRLDRVSITGQLRFVYDECAVLLGVHGAGLTNAIGLREGTAVVEIMPKSRSFQYFRNVAALMNRTSYDIFYADGSGAEGEVDLLMNEADLVRMVDLVMKRLQQSLGLLTA